MDPRACAVRDPGVRGGRSRARQPRARARPTSSSSTHPIPGSGKVFDWRLAEGAPRGKRILLAGGLTPENVGDAIRLVRPWGVDVSSGVEQSPGRKDPGKLRRFVVAAREAAARDHRPRRRPGDRPHRRRRGGRRHPALGLADRPVTRREIAGTRTVQSAGCLLLRPEVPRRGSPVRLEPPGPEPVGLGRFGEFGGRFAPETLVPALEQLEARVPQRRGPTTSSATSTRRCCRATRAGPRPSPNVTASRSGSAFACC